MRYLKLFEDVKPVPSFDHIRHNFKFRSVKGSNPFDRLYDKNKRENLDFDVYLSTKGFNLQRDFVWTLLQRQQFILSILKESPIPKVAVIRHKTKTEDIYQIIDGKQRIKAYCDFCDDVYPITINGHEYYYSELPQEMINCINRFSFQGDMAFSYEDEPITDDDKIRWFNQLNFAGTPQEQDHVNKLKSAIK
jgi:hypothetical protein